MQHFSFPPPPSSPRGLLKVLPGAQIFQFNYKFVEGVSLHFSDLGYSLFRLLVSSIIEHFYTSRIFSIVFEASLV